MSRPRFGFTPAQINDLLDYVISEGQAVIAPPLNVTLPDPDDVMFLEVAVAAHAEWLITSNLRHYPAEYHYDVNVIDPHQFVAWWTSQQT